MTLPQLPIVRRASCVSESNCRDFKTILRLSSIDAFQADHILERLKTPVLEELLKVDQNEMTLVSNDVDKTGGICPKSPTITMPKLPKPLNSAALICPKDIGRILLLTCSRRLEL